MNLYQKTKQYIHLRNKRIRNAFKLAYEGKLSIGDYFAFTALVCVLVIVLTLRYADEIDGIKNHAEIMRQAAEQNQAEAIRREEVIVSMLNGHVVLNGRVVTLCQLNAAGDCRKCPVTTANQNTHTT